jgi:predicted dehydrogenase
MSQTAHPTNPVPTAAQPPLRLGILGAARIAPRAVIYPARAMPTQVQITAVAARDPARARRFATDFAIPHVHADYAALVADPEIDAIYNPLPNSLHAPWTLRALAAGKHVLCEKPMAANAEEAAHMAAAAASSGNVLMEAFHYRYHPLITRALEIIHAGELGPIRHLEAIMCIPLYRFRDIRYRYALAGGALMDVGCYAIHLLRTLSGQEPKVTRAHVWRWSEQIDRRTEADFLFPTGQTGRIVCSLWSRTLLKFGARVVGEQGTLTIVNPFLPHYVHRLQIVTPHGKRTETVDRTPTYTYQMRAFVDAIRTGAAFPTDPADAVANQRVIDAVYHWAGLRLRGATTP